MADIKTLLNRILSAVYGKDVRQSIHDAIHQCYEDGRCGATDLIAREQIDALKTQTVALDESIHEVKSWSDLNAIMTTAAASMKLGSVKVFSVRINDDSGQFGFYGIGRLTIHVDYCVEDDTAAASAELVSSDIYKGYRLLNYGSAVGDTSVASNWSFLGWEYDNPPLIPDRTYPTTERYNGRKVYVRRMRYEFGGITSGHYDSFASGPVSHLVDVHATFFTNDGHHAYTAPAFIGADKVLGGYASASVLDDDGNTEISCAVAVYDADLAKGYADVIVKWTAL